MKAGCFRGCLGTLLGAAAGALLAMTWIHFNPPAVTPEYLNSDGLNRYGGEMALLMMGILVGATAGGGVGINKALNKKR